MSPWRRWPAVPTSWRECPPRASAERRVWRDAIQQPCGAALEGGSQVGRLGDDGECLDHRAGDERRHLVPASTPGMVGECICLGAPAVVLEEAAVRWRGGVEADRAARLGKLVVSRRDDDRGGQGDGGCIPGGVGGGRGDGG